jgi:hypothetical protein
MSRNGQPSPPTRFLVDILTLVGRPLRPLIQCYYNFYHYVLSLDRTSWKGRISIDAAFKYERWTLVNLALPLPTRASRVVLPS